MTTMLSTIFDSWYCLNTNKPPLEHGQAGVYFLTYVGDEDKIKIGRAKCIDARLRHYLTHHYRDIKVLCCVYAAKATESLLEKEFHNLFSKSKYDKEWYNPTDFLLNTIEEIKKINNFIPFVIPRKGAYIFEDTNHLSFK